MCKFDGFSSITFDKLGLRARVSRVHRIAGVSDLVTRQTIGALKRQVEGQIDWASFGDNRPCPVEIFNVVATMI